MAFGTSIFLIAVGAILDFAVETNTAGFDVQAAGVILMIVGALGLLLAMLFWNDWLGYRRSSVTDDVVPSVRRRVVHDTYDDTVPTHRRVVRHEEYV